MTIFHKVLSTIQKNALVTVSLFAVVFGVSIWGLSFSKLELDIYDVFDPSFQSSVDNTEIKQDFNDQSQVLVTFKFPGTPPASSVCKLMEWSRRLERKKNVQGVTSIWSVRKPRSEGSKLWYPKVLQNPCEMPSETRLAFSETLSSSYFRHFISSRGASDVVFDVSFKQQASDLQLIQELMDETRSFVHSELEGVKVSFLGLASFRYHFRKIIQRDSIYSALIIIVIILFMRVFFGTWRSGIFLVITILGSNLMLYAGLAFLGYPIDILTNNLFLMTAVAGTADFIFVSQYQTRGSYQESLELFIIPCFFTTFTTIIGFLSLNTSDLGLIQRFGTAAAFGALAEWSMLFLFLPAFLKLIKLERVWVIPANADKFNRLFKWQTLNLPRGVTKLLLILTFLSLPSFYFLNDKDSPIENLPSGHELRVAYESFQRDFNWQGQVFLYFPQLPEAALQEKILDAVKTLPLVHKSENPNDLVKEWTAGVPPLREQLIARELSMTPLWEKYYSQSGTLRIPLYLKEQDLHSLKGLRNHVDEICQGQCRLAGQRIVYLEYGEKIAKTMIESFAVSILLVVTVLGLILAFQNKFSLFLPVVMSSLMGPLVTLTLIALFQIPVTLVTSIFLAVMVGLAGDNAIQFLLVPRELDLSRAIEDRSRSSFLITLVMILGSSLFLFQTLWPMKILGSLFIMGFFVNFIGDVFGLKGLLSKRS